MLKNSQLKEGDGQLTDLFATAVAESIKRDKQFSLFGEHSRVQGVDQIVTKYSPVAKKFSVKRNGRLIDGFICSYHSWKQTEWTL